MDEQDVAILRELARAPRASYGAVGARVHLSANAVKARMRRLQDEGVVQGFAAQPHPALLDMEEGLLVFGAVPDLAEREDELLQGLPEVPGVVTAEVASDESVYLHVLARDEADWERIERAAVSLVGKPPTRIVRAPLPPAPARLSPSDWRIVRALLTEGRMALNDLCAATGLSFKTAKRRLQRLLAEGSLRIEPVVSPAEAAGRVLYSLLLVLDEGSDARALLDVFPEAIASRTPGSRIVQLHGAAPTFRAARAQLRRAKALPDVEEAFLHVATRRRGVAWLDEAIAARLRAEEPRPEPAPPVPVPTARN